MADSAERRVIIPADMELSDAEKERIRAQLESEPIDTIEGTRARIAFVKEEFRTQSKEEIAKVKQVATGKVKVKAL